MNYSNTRHRQSNIELLRVFAMFLVMFGHTYLRFHPFPQAELISHHPIQSFLNVMSGCLSTMGVGIFIAISGWFGIKFRRRGLAYYLFLVFFTLWSIYGLAIVFNHAKLNSDGIKISLSFFEGYWFVIGYLGLYIISPILNTFINHASKRQFLMVLLAYFLFQSYYSWLTAWYNYYSGYSIFLFSGIYLTAAYFHKYPIVWVEKYSWKLLLMVILLMSIVATFSLWKYDHAARQIRDDNPMVIIACILLLLCFNKMRFQSRFVNWLATSCFAVYLIHFSPFVYPHLMRVLHAVYVQNDGLANCVLFLFCLSAVYLCCTLYDQIRVMAWKGFLLLINKTFAK